MPFSFTKMHCDGNDYIVMETFTQDVYDLFTLSLILTDRRCGAGADALLEIAPSEVADAALHIYAPDGTSADTAGCAVRCAVKLLADQKICEKDRFTIETEKGVRNAYPVDRRRNSVSTVCEEILLQDAIFATEHTVQGKNCPIYAVEQDGKHAVLLFEECFADLDDIEQVNLAAVASELNRMEGFHGNSVEIFQAMPDGTAKMRMWIPGAGEVRGNARGVAACMAAWGGSGKNSGEPIRVSVRGGEMTAKANGNTLLLTGSVKAVYDGVSLL